jgi:uncharacterized protein (DUF1501 family)
MLKRLTKRGVGTETFQAIDNLKKIDPATYQPENGDDYPKSRFGQSIREIAELIRSDIGLDVALLDSGGWDHHVNERAVQDQLANLLRDLGQGIAAFHQDMGDRMENVVFVSMSEFGRAAHENGNRGPDDDHANGMFVTGGPVKGGKDYGRWPGWMPPHFCRGRDLAMNTDFRAVLNEIVVPHLGNRDVGYVFPGFTGSHAQLLNLL